MIIVDLFRVILNFVPYNEWLRIRNVCQEWNETIEIVCSETRIVNFANGFSVSHFGSIDDLISDFFLENWQTVKKEEYRHREMTMRQLQAVPFFFKRRQVFKNQYSVGDEGEALLRLFSNMEELIINGTLYESIFGRKQGGILDLKLVTKLKTITIVNHALDCVRIKILPRSVETLRFCGVTVMSRPFLKSAVRHVKNISFEYFVGDKEDICDFTSSHINLSFGTQMGLYQWTSDQNLITEYAKNMNEQFQIQLHQTFLEGYFTPNLSLYACIADTEKLREKYGAKYTPFEYETNHQLVRYCFLEKKFPIDIELLFILGYPAVRHFRLFELLDIARYHHDGQLERLRKQGTLLIESKSLLSVTNETDSETTLRLINEYGFDPNVAHNDSRTMTSQKYIAVPLIFQLIFSRLPDTKILKFCNSISSETNVSVDFTLEHKGFSIARWAMAYGRSKLLKHSLRHGSELKRVFDFREFQKNTIKNLILNQIKTYAQVESSQTLWNMLVNSPETVYEMGEGVFDLDKSTFKHFKSLAKKLKKNVVDLLLLPSKPKYDTGEHSTVNSMRRGKSSIKARETTLFDVILQNQSGTCIKQLATDVLPELEKIGSQDLNKLLGFNPIRQRYMAHIMADETAFRDLDSIPLFTRALQAMPSLTQPDNNTANPNAKNTVFHHMSGKLKRALIDWVHGNCSYSQNEDKSSKDTAIADQILETITQDEYGCFHLQPKKILQEKNVAELFNFVGKNFVDLKDENGLTVTQICCLEGSFFQFMNLIRSNKTFKDTDDTDYDPWADLFIPIKDPDDHSIRYSLFALSSARIDWGSRKKIKWLEKYADFSLLTPDRASLIHALANSSNCNRDNFRKIVKRCLENGINIDMQTIKYRQTALHISAINNSTERFECLIENGANAVDLYDIRGRSAFSYASVKQKLCFFEFLRRENNNYNEKIQNLKQQIPVSIVQNKIDAPYENIFQEIKQLASKKEEVKIDWQQSIAYYDVYDSSNYPFVHSMERLDVNQLDEDGYINGRKVVAMNLLEWGIYLGSKSLVQALTQHSPIPIDKTRICDRLARHLLAKCEIEEQLSVQNNNVSSQLEKTEHDQSMNMVKNWKDIIILDSSQKDHWRSLSQNYAFYTCTKKNMMQLIKFLYQKLKIKFRRFLDTKINYSKDSNIDINYDNHNNYNNKDNDNNTNNQKSILCDNMSIMHLFFYCEPIYQIIDFLECRPKGIPYPEPMDAWGRTPLDMYLLKTGMSQKYISSYSHIFAKNNNDNEKKRKRETSEIENEANKSPRL